jgi:hypothetical protein
MKRVYQPGAFLKWTAGLLVIFSIFTVSCKEEEPSISNDLRVLKALSNGNDLTDGSSDIENESVAIELIFSHILNKEAFEQALSFSGTESYLVSYDESGSFATLSFGELAFETGYTISLPKGAYGANGETLRNDFSVSFTTKAFVPPALTLSADASSVEEGSDVVITATIDRAISSDVIAVLNLDGSATIDLDYTIDNSTLTIAAGNTSTTAVISTLSDAENEGEETIDITIASLENADEATSQNLVISLLDQIPALELKGVMELDNYIDGSGGRVRAIHVRAREDIPNLGIYGIEIASNGAAPNPADIDFVFADQSTASAGEDILIVRDLDEALAATYFGACYSNFTVIQSGSMTHNGDDAILLYLNGVAVESFGEPGVDGTGTYWEYTDSWAYKLGEEWIYAGVGCVVNAVGEATDATSTCRYPFCDNSLVLRGVMSLQIGGTTTNGRAVQIQAMRDIADISNFGLGIANNGGGSDGREIDFPAIAVKEGDMILLARDIDVEGLAAYFGACYQGFDHVIPSDGVNFNGDDPFELYDGMDVIETYGDVALDGSGLVWEYTGGWAYKAIGQWAYNAPGCAAGATDNASATCVYTFCN